MEQVPVPDKLSQRQIMIAKAWTKEKHETGITVKDFCSKYNLSSATFYKWQDDLTFSKYLSDLSGEIITDDEREAYEKVKKKIMQLATQKNASVKEIQLFTDHFQYIVENEKRETMKKLGINPDAGNSADNRSIEDKKAILIGRLTNKGD